jgi:HEAT repeat protein
VCSICFLLLLLAGCGKSPPPYEGKSVSELEEMLRSPDEARQLQGAFGLSRQGADAAPALPALRQALQSDKAPVRQAAAQALGKIGNAEAVPDLVAALRDSHWPVRRQAAVALGELGPAARAARPDLEKLRRDPDPLVRKAAQDALHQIGS